MINSRTKRGLIVGVINLDLYLIIYRCMIIYVGVKFFIHDKVSVLYL
jgi:hypothetical protein